MSFILVVKQRGAKDRVYLMEKKVQAMYNAQRLGSRLSSGGVVEVLEMASPTSKPRLVGAYVKNPASVKQKLAAIRRGNRKNGRTLKAIDAELKALRKKLERLR